MILVNELRRGMAIVLNGSIHKVVESQHVKPGKGGAFVKTRLKRVDSGAVVDHTFRSAEKVEQAVLTDRAMEYLYREDDHLHFMDKETYDQISLSTDQAGEGADRMPENTDVTFVMHGEDVVDVLVPDSVELTITKTDPGVRGDTASGGSKPAETSTGLVVQVPLFLEEGDKIMVSLKAGKYLGRR